MDGIDHEPSWTTVGSKSIIEIDTKGVFGYGVSSKVYSGRFDERPVAVKRINPSLSKFECEVETLRRLDHRNIVRYLYTDSDNEFVYIVLERCDCSLQDCLDKKMNTCGLLDDELDVLKQISAGLLYLHSKSILHRNIHPSNVLLTRKDGIVVVRLSDFGVVKNVEEDFSISASVMGEAGNYFSPEVLRKQKISKKSDVFSLGLVYFSVLSDGKSPYGDDGEDIIKNVRAGISPNFAAVSSKYNGYAVPLLISMLNDKKRFRPLVTDVLAHYLFWDPDMVFTFFQDVSDYLTDNMNSPRVEMELISREIIGSQHWQTKLLTNLFNAEIRLFQKEFNAYRLKDDVIGLLRQIRNWGHHYHSKSRRLKNIIGETKNQMLTYMTSLFPLLLPKTYDVFQVVKTNPSFSDYY
ncbi:serine/threonine-protein kinase/endoribonuclease ire-1-like [Styela clava]